ncbi:serine/threonine protein kinase [Oscillochloris trichoides DG-6]|uniref:Serine/threonine protein kinase n=1 Tax=Oscillochloris trichoides DG-6 TaxID=765420 RepID=E1IIB0_9CHLR|nr:protein kinase [Oscillochloris trichoides]EFO79060.1 serine/threonine protein kinase [Oscillochloris trichoides DG-6]
MQTQNPAEFPANTLINQRYLITRTIGRGGMGAVYEAVDQRLGATVALKQMTVTGANVATAFEREARILASLRHPALPKVSDFFADAQGQFLVMEYIPGNDLGHLLTKRGQPFPVEEVVRWADQCLAVLEYLHSQNPPIIHRDIKPQNLKLTPAGEIVLLDFGLAKGYANVQSPNTASIFAYTPNYAPLEQVQGSGTGPLSDLYALAATIYHLLAGAPPPDVLQRLGATASGQPDPLQMLSLVNPQVPQPLAAWVAHGMQLDQRNRPPSAAAMRRDLTQIMRAGPVANVGPTVVQPRGYDPTVVQASPAAPPPLPRAAPPPPPPAFALPLDASAPVKRRGCSVLPIIVGLVVLLAAGGGVFWFVTRDGGPGTAPTSVAVGATRTPRPSATPTDDRAPTAGAVQAGATSSPTGPSSGASGTTGTTPSGIQYGPVEQLFPYDIMASDAAPDGIDAAGNPISYSPWNVVDGYADTAWRVPGDGIGQGLQLELGAPMLISEVQVIPGYAKVDPTDGTNRFWQNRRVVTVSLEFSDGSSIAATFADDPSLQSIRLPKPVLSSYVRLVILETTAVPPEGGRDFTPISEIVIMGQMPLP